LPADDPKAALREEARARRREAFVRFGARIGPVLAANFLARFSLAPGERIGGYWPIGEEADIRPLMTALAERGHRVALPAVVRPGLPLRFLAWRPGDALRPGFRGIPEPEPGAGEIVPEVVLVPLLAFDRTGARLGYGGGYFDRTLAALRAGGGITAIGIAYSAQEVDSLPGRDHDQRLDWIVTELGTRRLSGDAGG
jgi:5-formyltetrahydrofolate cyclo-ligase